MCVYCWTNREQYQPVGEADSEHYRALQQDSEVRAHRRLRTRRNARIALAGVVVVLASWWGYSTFVATPSLLPLPASTARSMEASPGTWASAGGGVARTRHTEAPAAIEAPEAWRSELGAPVSAALVVDEERIYAALDDRRLVALSSETGEVAWERAYGQHLTVSPTVAGDLLYVVAGRSPNPTSLQALDAATGEVRWEASVGSQVYGAPMVDDGAVYVFGQNEMFGFEAEDGDQLWRRGIDTDWAFIDRPFLSPVLSDQYLMVSTDNRVLVFDRETGEQTYWWDFQSFPEHLAVDEDGLLYGISNRFVAAIDPDASRPWWDGVRGAWTQFWIWGMAPQVPPPPHEWASANPPSTILPLAIDGERVYLAGRRGDIRALDQSTGRTLWERDGGAYADGPIRTASGVLLASGDTLMLLDPASGADLSTRTLEGQRIRRVTPTSHGLYVATEGGDILALR